MIQKCLSFLFPALLLGMVPSQGQELSWYRVYKGNIAKYPIVLQLYKTAHSYSGFYYYTSQEKPLAFSGEDSSLPGGKIRLSVYLPDRDSSETFSFSLNGKRLTGEWTSIDNKTLPFSAEEAVMPLAFDYIYTEGSVQLRPKLPESPAASYESACVWPQGNSIQASFVKSVIREEFGEKNSAEDIGKIMLRQKKEFFANYLKENKDVQDAELKDSYSYNQDVSGQITIAYQSPNLLVLSDYSYSYTGGVHGNYGTSYMTIDLLNNKKLALSDVFTGPGIARLPKLLEKYFRKDYQLKPTDSLSEGGLFQDDIKPNDNFYVSAKGIGFSYTPYEIGPYAMGQIEIFIPFVELTAYLQPGFRKLIR